MWRIFNLTIFKGILWMLRKNQLLREKKYLHFRNVILPLLLPYKFRITDLRLSCKILKGKIPAVIELLHKDLQYSDGSRNLKHTQSILTERLVF